MKLYLLLCLVVLGESIKDLSFGHSYKFTHTVQLFTQRNSNAGGYQIRATANIEPVHQGLLSVKIGDVSLYSQTKDSFKQRTSSLDVEDNSAFFIEISEGIVKAIYISESENLPVKNLKKSLANLLQFQTKPGERNEEDLNGHCKTKYLLKDNGHILKLKTDCSVDSTLKGSVWSGAVLPRRVTEIDVDKNTLQFVKFSEEYNVKSNIVSFAEASIASVTELDIIDETSTKTSDLAAGDVELYIERFEKESGKKFIKTHLTVDVNFDYSGESKTKSFDNVIEENRKVLTNKELGGYRSAVGALKVLRSLKDASQNELYSLLKSKKNKKIIPQLLDLLGALQTSDSHKAAMKFLNLNSKDCNIDFCERYLWALSTSARHTKEIIEDLRNVANAGVSDQKLQETLVQTISAMSRKQYEDTYDEKVLEETLNLLTTKLKNCSKEDDLCQRIYLKSFGNLGSTDVIDLLLEYAVNGTRSSSTRAMRALWKLGKNSWNSNVLNAAKRIYFSNSSYDSSAKTVALDILLETVLNDSDLIKIIQIFKDKSVSYELKEYLLQRLSQHAKTNEELYRSFKRILVSENLNHYDALATGGLSTAFDRRFMTNAYLSTAQEVKSGILKQGYVHINVEHGGSPSTVFTLGLFSSGLGSFVSDDSDDDDDGVNAGLELSVLGVEFRPFIFFSSHGELMGHVFSGTGSTITPAYQAFLLLEDDTTFVPTGAGEVLKVSFSSIASVDLSGKIGISLWNRNAHSLVQNRAGIIFEETIEILSPFAYSQIIIEVTAEPQLKLSSDIEFYDKVALCLSLEQPSTNIQYNTSSVIQIAGSKYRKKNIKHSNIFIPGRTYALNSKNDEMCNAMSN